ncbi:MAG TPA: hypothetical protein VEJ44_00815 [Acidimicrobiales bacterium]|nr:hypothetical protein [Acidimicrobiales bacterium]
MTASPTRRHPAVDRPTARRPSDAGGVWIATGVVLGVLAYAAVVLMLIAGYTSVLPVVVVPIVLVVLIASANVFGGGRAYGRSPAPSDPEGASPSAGGDAQGAPGGSGGPGDAGESR